jgi:hypothetical protein
VLHLTTHTRLDRRTCGFKRQDVGDHDTYALQAKTADGGLKVVGGIAAGREDVVIAVERPGAVDGTLVGFQDPPAVYVKPTAGEFRLLPGQVEGTRFRVPGLAPGGTW